MAEHLTDLEQLLLLATLRVGEQAYGASLQQDLESGAGRRASLGTIHVTMGRLEDRGLVASTKTAPTGGRGGKGRRVYTVTPAGTEALRRARRTLDEMWAGVPREAG